MDRREFISVSGATFLSSMALAEGIFAAEPARAAGTEVTWRRQGTSKLFDQVACRSQPNQWLRRQLWLDPFARRRQTADAPRYRIAG